MASVAASAIRWLQLKRYQFEVTIPLYMLTPRERFVFYSVLFLLFSMIFIATSLYLPEHIVKVAHRASFYWAGDEDAILASIPSASKAIATASPILPTPSVHTAVGEL